MIDLERLDNVLYYGIGPDRVYGPSSQLREHLQLRGQPPGVLVTSIGSAELNLELSASWFHLDKPEFLPGHLDDYLSLLV
jgi:hypothetical protein